MRLLVDGVDVAPVTIADSYLQKFKGLMGRASFDGAMYFPNVPSVHTFFMRIAIDVAFLDEDHVVQGVRTMKPWRPVGGFPGAKHVLESAAGSFEKWNLVVGSRISFAEVAS